MFKLFLNSDNAPAVLAWLAGLIAAFLIIRLGLTLRRVWPLFVAEQARLARLASFRERFGCDPRSMSVEQLASITQGGSL